MSDGLYANMRGRVKAGDFVNSPTARVYPGPGNHLALAEYWGLEAASCLRSVDAGQNVDLNAEHAWRVSKMAWFHALKARNVKEPL